MVRVQRDTFESLIHKNVSIIDTQKFHHLKASLQGDAASVIQSIDFTATNYNVAWQALCERYNNKRLLIQNHIKPIFELESVTKESARAIRNLIDTTFRHLRAVESLGQSIVQWDALLVYITSKMDKTSIQEWEKGHGAVDTLTLKSLKIFLNGRAEFLETFELIIQNLKTGK